MAGWPMRETEKRSWKEINRKPIRSLNSPPPQPQQEAIFLSLSQSSPPQPPQTFLG